MIVQKKNMLKRFPPKLSLILTVLLLVTSACTLGRETVPDATAPAPATGTAAPKTQESGPAVPDVPAIGTPEGALTEEPGPGLTLPEITLPEVNGPADALGTAQAVVGQAGDLAGTAAQQAGEAAGTAVQQAGQAAGTAAVVATEQGGAALATIQAINTPDITELTERLSAVRPDENGNVSVTLTEAELNQLLRLRYLVLSAEPELRDASVRFAAGEIRLDGTVPLLLPVGVTLTLRPLVIDGRLELEILDAALGPVETPEVVLGFASNLVSDALTDTIRRLPAGFQLQAIDVDEGRLTISGKIEE